MRSIHYRIDDRIDDRRYIIPLSDLWSKLAGELRPPCSSGCSPNPNLYKILVDSQSLHRLLFARELGKVISILTPSQHLTEGSERVMTSDEKKQPQRTLTRSPQGILKLIPGNDILSSMPFISKCAQQSERGMNASALAPALQHQ